MALLDITTETVAFLIGAAFFAGWIDAVVGGGGLIQLPALLVALPGAAPIQILATNKFSSIFGTTTSAITYVRRIGVDRKTAIPLALAAFTGSAAGAFVASRIPKEAFNPIVLVALVLVGAYTLLRPDMGRYAAVRYEGRRLTVLVTLIGVTIGFYDGALGPGTGSFFVFALVGLGGYAFLGASAKAKIANAATNLAALVVFVPQGAVLWSLGLAMAAANMAGGYLGARTAMARGSTFVRVVFMLVVGGFIVRIGYDLARDLL
ncbi:MAG: TSUP family transporter [Dermatophilus congolensis]|nr:TSUP family transporter [Dermatophilus congolensis]